MEVAMTHAANRLTLSALPALVLVTAVAANPALAQPDAGHTQEMEYLKQEKWAASQEQKTFKRLTARRSGETAYGYRSEYTARAEAPSYQWRWWQDYSSGGR
jgi:hypothetical protein